MPHRFNRGWKSVRIPAYLKERLEIFKESYMYKSEADIAETAIAEFMKNKEIESFGYSLHDLRKHYEDDRESFEKIGIKDFHQYMQHLISKGEGSMNKVFKDKLAEIMEYMQDLKVKLDKTAPEPEKHRY